MFQRRQKADPSVGDVPTGPAAPDELEAELGERLSRVTRELAGLNRELASQMVTLAAQTGDAAPLIGAVRALRKVKDYYDAGPHDPDAMRQNLDVQESLADTLLALGRSGSDADAVGHAVLAYRSAITLASLIGDEAARRRLRTGHAAAQAHLSRSGQAIPARRVA